MRRIERSEEEIREVEDRCIMSIHSAYPGMSYEEGIDAVLRRLFEKDADPPFDD